MRRHELTDEEWAIIQPLLPNKVRGVPRVDDMRVLNGILWRFRMGAAWRDVPERYGPRTTLYNRFVRCEYLLRFPVIGLVLTLRANQARPHAREMGAPHPAG